MAVYQWAHLAVIFEFRVGLSVLCLFLLEGGDMHLAIVGSHDEVVAYIRNAG
jgi:hypothetical protein